MPEVSVVIPARNEGVWVRRTVDAVLHASEPASVEVIVVDDGSDDGSCDFLRHGSAAASVIDGPGRGVSAARNAGAERARGTHLFFLDAHVIPEGGWLREPLQALRDPSVGIVGQAVRSLYRQDAVGYTHHVVNEALANAWGPKQADEPFEVPSIVGCGQGYRREVFDRLGRFDAGNVGWGVEDVGISLRAWMSGYRCICCPNAAIGHLFRDSRVPSPAAADAFETNLARCLLTCFTGWRLRALAAGNSVRPTFRAALARVADDRRFWEWRAEVRARFVRDDAWYLERFAADLAAFRGRLAELAAALECRRGLADAPARCEVCGLVDPGALPECPRCGAELPTGKRFCSKCGTPAP